MVGLCKADILASNTLYSIWSKTPDFSLLYILCILNSKLIKKYWSTTYSDNKLLFSKIKGYQLKERPIKKIPLQEQTPLIHFAEQMLDAQE
ncbi:TaqI-like C-terminal specificity domain-containing protein [Treponema sp. OMZ 838]|uniref:TaqI-like C-terminal specificity domain-containing protein n=1 Tax=Treponema sp. OMZ 838 TaxID=1539298 RepID=UPI0035107702